MLGFIYVISFYFSASLIILPFSHLLHSGGTINQQKWTMMNIVILLRMCGEEFLLPLYLNNRMKSLLDCFDYNFSPQSLT